MEDIQTKLLNIGNYGCLCFCYLYCIGINSEQLVLNYDRLVSRGIIGEDCFVKDGEAFLKYFGSNKQIVFTLTDNKEFDKYISCFKFKDKNHFVVTDKYDNIVYNPYFPSQCVKYGSIVSKRTLI